MADEKTLKNSLDARFRFALSEDGMTLGVSRYFPPNGGREPSVNLIREQVAQAGVQLPVDEAAAQRVVDAIREDRPFTGIALVRGVHPREPQHGSIVALGDLEYPVFPQDSFARNRCAVAACHGLTIDGTDIPTKQDFTPDDIQISVGDNVDWDPATETYVSRIWGMAHLTGGVITVTPAAHITADEISVMGTIHHRDFQGNPLTPARLEKEIRDMGVVTDIDADHLESLIKQAANTGAPLVDQVITEGTHPIPGRDGWLEFLVATREAAGTENEKGTMDFRNRGVHPMVRPEQVIARYHGPTSGEIGINVYGKTIPASTGQELHIRLGENVVLLEDGVTYQSKAEGVAVMERNQLSVTACLVIPGNVDYASGNVRVEHGSVRIKGSIQAGFLVSAPEHIIVDGSIESAIVEAGGMVTAAGGILMPEGGRIVAGGEVSANYAVNALIRAGGDVTFSNEVTNSVIHTQGKLMATSGKGIVQGGTITTGKGALVNEIGSELGVKTLIQVNIEHPEDESLRAQRAKMTQAIRKIDEALGTDEPEAILKRTPKARRSTVAEVLTHRQTLSKRRRAITDQIHKLIDARQRQLAGVTISAKRGIHPGTVVAFGKKSRQFGKAAGPSTLFWDSGNWTIGIR